MLFFRSQLFQATKVAGVASVCGFSVERSRNGTLPSRIPGQIPREYPEGVIATIAPRKTMAEDGDTLAPSLPEATGPI